MKFSLHYTLPTIPPHMDLHNALDAMLESASTVDLLAMYEALQNQIDSAESDIKVFSLMYTDEAHWTQMTGANYEA